MVEEKKSCCSQKLAEEVFLIFIIRYFMTIFGGSWKLVYFDNDVLDF